MQLLSPNMQDWHVIEPGTTFMNMIKMIYDICNQEPYMVHPLLASFLQ